MILKLESMNMNENKISQWLVGIILEWFKSGKKHELERQDVTMLVNQQEPINILLPYYQSPIA